MPAADGDAASDALWIQNAIGASSRAGPRLVARCDDGRFQATKARAALASV